MKSKNKNQESTPYTIVYTNKGAILVDNPDSFRRELNSSKGYALDIESAEELAKRIAEEFEIIQKEKNQQRVG